MEVGDVELSMGRGWYLLVGLRGMGSLGMLGDLGGSGWPSSTGYCGGREERCGKRVGEGCSLRDGNVGFARER